MKQHKSIGIKLGVATAALLPILFASVATAGPEINQQEKYYHAQFDPGNPNNEFRNAYSEPVNLQFRNTDTPFVRHTFTMPEDAIPEVIWMFHQDPGFCFELYGVAPRSQCAVKWPAAGGCDFTDETGQPQNKADWSNIFVLGARTQQAGTGRVMRTIDVTVDCTD